MIKLNLSALTHAPVGHYETYDLDIDEVAAGDVDLSHLKGELGLTRVEEGILVLGKLNAEAKTECTRCLTPFLLPISFELEDVILLANADTTPERPVRVNEEGWVDLAPLVREYAWLAIPARAVCSPTCKGICPECGGNRNLGECDCEEVERIDPRWEALRELADELDDN